MNRDGGDRILLYAVFVVAGLVLLALFVAAYRGTVGDTRRFTPPTKVTIYEDGSGVGTFPAGTFTWNCQEQGNEVCG